MERICNPVLAYRGRAYPSVHLDPAQTFSSLRHKHSQGEILKLGQKEKQKEISQRPAPEQRIFRLHDRYQRVCLKKIYRQPRQAQKRNAETPVLGPRRLRGRQARRIETASVKLVVDYSESVDCNNQPKALIKFTSLF